MIIMKIFLIVISNYRPTLLWQNTITGGVDGNALALVQTATAFVEKCISSFPTLFLMVTSFLLTILYILLNKIVADTNNYSGYANRGCSKRNSFVVL